MNRRDFLYRVGTTGMLAALTVPGTSAQPPQSSDPKVLKVSSPGSSRGIGVNYFDLFQRLLRKPGKREHLENLARLKKAQIPFARFACCGFWPSDWDLYLKSRGDYFRVLDQVIHAAEQAGFGLIPSLFWLHSAVPDLVHEPMQALGDSKSKSVEFIRDYTREIVAR